MEMLEVHTLLCSKDVDLFKKTYTLFNHHAKVDSVLVVHSDGSLTNTDKAKLTDSFKDVEIINRERADTEIISFLKDYELCTHFRTAPYHTIFKIKLFDIFLFTKSNNILYIDSDVLFCKQPDFINRCFTKKTGFYLRDSWSSYCVPFRDEDNDITIDRNINAGLTYFPSQRHFELLEIENCLRVLYQHGSRGATHPFLEQTCIAYMITKLKQKGTLFEQLPHPDYCVPTFNGFIPDHNLTCLHLTSSPLVGHSLSKHYDYELAKIS